MFFDGMSGGLARVERQNYQHWGFEESEWRNSYTWCNKKRKQLIQACASSWWVVMGCLRRKNRR